MVVQSRRRDCHGVLLLSELVEAGASAIRSSLLSGLPDRLFGADLALKIRANRKTKVIFRFYVAANEILVDGDSGRYHFEIARRHQDWPESNKVYA